MVNELVWTENVEEVVVRRVVRKCMVVEVEGEVPELVEWAAGSSDWFFYRRTREKVTVEGKSEVTGGEGEVGMTDELSKETDVSSVTTEPVPLSVSPSKEPKKESIAPSISETVVPAEDVTPTTQTQSLDKLYHIPEEKQLRGLDLFCGGGNFGRGVADGGAVHVKWHPSTPSSLTFARAVDIDINAIHSYKANLEHDDVNLYLGSINNFLFDVITHRRKHLPSRGSIDFILAGSPCQGFSNANPMGHEATKSLHNSALICTTLSAIDYYRPKYALLENVPAMATDRTYKQQRVNVSNQVMCALIGLGYQCRCLHLDAWNFGAAQSRTRLFIEVAAPGCVLPEVPLPSHAHGGNVRARAVGKTAASLKYAERDLDILTSFPPVTLADVWDPLPSVGNAHLGVCVPFPDHKTYWNPNARDRRLAAVIPHSDPILRNPGYKFVFFNNLLPDHLHLRYVPLPVLDHRFERIFAGGLAPTVTCGMTPPSVVSGRTLHYGQDRVMTNLEAKRVQGFRDTDVLVGTMGKGFRIVGNSVCRQVAFALGGKLAEAVLRGLDEGKKGGENEVDSKVERVEDVEDISMESPVKMRKTPMKKLCDAIVKTPGMTVMVLIDNRKRKQPGNETHSPEDLQVQYTVQNGMENLQASFPKRQRRIRIELDDDECV
jgi:site-specific DNA-cytosine methylase